MKWRERGMVCMNKLFNQQYFKYLYKSNRRLLILIWAILFICICFFTTIFTINDFTAYSEVQAFVTAMSGFCGISISMFVPIYFFRFLYRNAAVIYITACRFAKRNYSLQPFSLAIWLSWSRLQYTFYQLRSLPANSWMCYPQQS